MISYGVVCKVRGGTAVSQSMFTSGSPTRLRWVLLGARPLELLDGRDVEGTGLQVGWILATGPLQQREYLAQGASAGWWALKEPPQRYSTSLYGVRVDISRPRLLEILSELSQPLRFESRGCLNVAFVPMEQMRF
jgi:hypothetical protein